MCASFRENTHHCQLIANFHFFVASPFASKGYNAGKQASLQPLHQLASTFRLADSKSPRAERVEYNTRMACDGFKRGSKGKMVLQKRASPEEN